MTHIFLTLLAASAAISQVAAQTQDSACVNAGGYCQSTGTSCSGSYLTNYCPSSGSTIKCCQPKQDSACTAINGSCKYTNTPCSSGYLSNYCPSSGNNVKCCASSSGSTSSPCGIPKTRAGLAAAALWAHNSGQSISYTQGASRWSGITSRTCPKSGGSNPSYADCSAFVTWIYWSAFGNGPDNLNGATWSAGYTGTLLDHGASVSVANVRLADLVFYENPAHVGIVVSLSPLQVVQFGSTGVPKLSAYNYRTVTDIRTYNSFF
ncbi:hypothetical protein HK097_010299 [Rhizophlyctis rosea]|uniref:Uncharacterized protein n=1 Tax=Rhizophlyctis rosea TaxID=64517 RepID=A0AAD5SB07_9FUNG|nr:hypothetical protein HK097_010299 [Rhizophlyctis rosea]